MHLSAYSVSEVGALLEGLGLGQYVQSFAGMAIDGSTLVECADSDLQEVGMSAKDSVRLAGTIAKMPVVPYKVDDAVHLVLSRIQDLQAAMLILNTLKIICASYPAFMVFCVHSI